MHAPDPVLAVRVALRVSLATAFLSAVADRFGWWEPLGQGNWGSMSAFADYTHQLVPFASGWLLTLVVWAATATETILGVLLLTGRWPRYVGAVGCLVLTVFGVAMAVSFGVESPLSYSVFTAASAAAAYAVLGTTPLPHRPAGTKSVVEEPRHNPTGAAAAQRVDNEAVRAAQAVFSEDHWRRWWT